MEDARGKMDAFLASVERRAFRMARIATGNTDDALDIVQDAMFGLVRKYGHKPETVWKPLFYRILNSRINDWYRRTRVRQRWQQWFGRSVASDPDANENPVEQLPDPAGDNPADRVVIDSASRALDKALHRLPQRQQQAFLLRAWEGLSVKETAKAMGCSQGSVKTHYSRALLTLRVQLEEHWP